ncbi:MAG: zinc-dependent metalloprotease [Chloroflexota bacterium]|nr:zinc-dependent metalloprotease [Dehalococcoidia bacterium]MDW8252882.1 zinc-dependent metalloprotease [Chloroflexota bacterium]
MDRSEPQRPGINWAVVRTTAHRAVGDNWLEVGEPLEQLRARYAAFVADAKHLIAEFTGWSLPAVPENVDVTDREGWVDVNIDQFRRLFDALTPAFLPEPGPSALNRVLAGAGATALSVQVGLLLGFLARLVLGQFDVALFGAAADRRVLFVEPNIQGMIESMGVDPDSFRFYLSLHETTHAAEFAAHPWLAEYLMDLLREYAGSAGDNSLSALLGHLVGHYLDDEPAGALGHLISEEQRAIFARLQAVMSLIEGYSDYVMHELAPRRLRDAAAIEREFAARRQHRSALRRVLFQLTGLDLKLAQYEMGRQFVSQVIEQAGRAAIDHVWRGPESLPTLSEIQHPSRWLKRMGFAASAEDER